MKIGVIQASSQKEKNKFNCVLRKKNVYEYVMKYGKNEELKSYLHSFINKDGIVSDAVNTMP
ncbi:MAG TPA: hypothetical protein DG753_00840 [Clostridium sp.]|nr:hypothetical protein [Clostridium sp.]